MDPAKVLLISALRDRVRLETWNHTRRIPGAPSLLPPGTAVRCLLLGYALIQRPHSHSIPNNGHIVSMYFLDVLSGNIKETGVLWTHTASSIPAHCKFWSGAPGARHLQSLCTHDGLSLPRSKKKLAFRRRD